MSTKSTLLAAKWQKQRKKYNEKYVVGPQFQVCVYFMRGRPDIGKTLYVQTCRYIQ